MRVLVKHPGLASTFPNGRLEPSGELGGGTKEWPSPFHAHWESDLFPAEQESSSCSKVEDVEFEPARQPGLFSVSEDSARGSAHDDSTQDLIGKQLRSLYDSVLSEPIPDRLVELLVKLDDVTVQRSKGKDGQNGGSPAK